MKIEWITNKKSKDSLLIDDRYQMYSDSVIYDTWEAQDIPQHIFKLQKWIKYRT